MWCPRQDSNLRSRLRRAVLYPLSYGGSMPQKGLGEPTAAATRVRSVAKHVLVVDDTPSIRFLIRTNLDLAGFEVDEVTDGVECLEYLAAAEQLPDAITVDVMMPRLDGVQTVVAIRAESRYDSIRVVMVTTQGHPLDIQRGRQAGADAYLTKPFDPDELVATVAEVLSRPPNKIDR